MNFKPATISVYLAQERTALEAMRERMLQLCKRVRFVDPEAQISFIDDEIFIECSENTREFIVRELCR